MELVRTTRAHVRDIRHGRFGRDVELALVELLGAAAALSLRCSRHLPMRDHRIYDLLAPLRVMNELLDGGLAFARVDTRRIMGLVMHLRGAASVLAAECRLPDEMHSIDACAQKAFDALGNTSSAPIFRVV